MGGGEGKGAGVVEMEVGVGEIQTARSPPLALASCGPFCGERHRSLSSTC